MLWGCGSERKTLSIATGGPAGLYYPIGGGMASIWSAELDQVNVKAEVTGGSVINVIQVSRRESDLGIAMADVVTAAYRGEGRFPEPLPVNVLFTAYPNIVHILTLADVGISGIGDMRGKRISVGAQGSGTAVAAENVLTGLGLTMDEIAVRFLSFGESTSALKDGTIDAAFVVGGLGLAAVTELAVTRDLKLINLSEEELQKLSLIFPAYAGYIIPHGTYAGVDSDTMALGIWSAVVVHEDMPEKLAFKLTCKLYQRRDKLLKVSQVAKAMTVANIHKLAAVPLHSGTQRYLADPRAPCDAVAPEQNSLFN
jgi:TRAP transporter TAXI family solute receptor